MSHETFGFEFFSTRPIIIRRFHVSNVKNLICLTFFPVIRGLERLLPVSALHNVLRWITWPRAFVNTAFKNPDPGRAQPPFLTIHKTKAIARRQRETVYLRQFLNFFPDRLAAPKWRQLCQIDGLEPVLAALAAGRAVILATLHFGVYAQTRMWLRAHGIPAATLAGGPIAKRSALLRVSDRYSPDPEIPVAFYQDQLRELKQHLSQGYPLIITCDGSSGKKVTVPFCDGWTIEIATGALRLAGGQRVEIFPLTTVDLGHWRTQIKVGAPVPTEFAEDFPAAAGHLIAACLPALRQYPDQSTFDLARHIKPIAIGNNPQLPVANRNVSGNLPPPR